MTARRRDLELSYAHPTKRRAGRGKYSPINKVSRTGYKMKIALIVKRGQELKALQAAEDAAKERVSDKINEEKEG